MTGSLLYKVDKSFVWKRAIAQIVDFLIVFLTVILFTYWIQFLGQLFWWFVLWTFLIYGVLMDTYYGGTVGKLYMGLKVVKTSDKRTDLQTALYRNLVKIVVAILCFDSILWLVIFLYSGLHNIVAKSVVKQNVT